jgi:Flp pilus assembly protein TadB
VTISWLLVGAALWLSGSRRGQPRAARPTPSRARLELLAAGAASVLAVGALGPVRGVLTAAVAVPLSVALVRRANARAARVAVEPRLPLALDLIAVALRAGQPVDAALLLAGPAAGALGPPLTRIGGLLRLGADPADAWAGAAAHPALSVVAATARRSATSGIRLAAAFEELARDLRAQATGRAQARAHRVGVLAAAPLGLCFLPAFVCLGIVPALIGLATGVLR